MCCGRDNVCMIDRIRKQSGSNQTSEMSHINYQEGIDTVSYFTEPLEVNGSGVSAPSGNDDRWFRLSGNSLNHVVVDHLGIGIDLI